MKEKKKKKNENWKDQIIAINGTTYYNMFMHAKLNDTTKYKETNLISYYNITYLYIFHLGYIRSIYFF